MDASLITLGAQAPDATLTLKRVALGTFFAISGYHKLFNASRHETLTRTMQDDGVHFVPIMQWLVPGIEFSGGCALIVGLLSALAAFGLFAGGRRTRHQRNHREGPPRQSDGEDAGAFARRPRESQRPPRPRRARLALSVGATQVRHRSPRHHGLGDTFVQWQPLSRGGILASVSMHPPRRPQ
jgi:hypothetical protein